MEKVNHQRVFFITLLKISSVIAIFFIINNWGSIRQSFDGEAPALQVWLSQALTFSNGIFIVFLSFAFYINTLKQHKEDIKERTSEEL